MAQEELEPTNDRGHERGLGDILIDVQTSSSCFPENRQLQPSGYRTQNAVTWPCTPFGGAGRCCFCVPLAGGRESSGGSALHSFSGDAVMPIKHFLPTLLMLTVLGCGSEQPSATPDIAGTYSDGESGRITIEHLGGSTYAVTLPDGQTASCKYGDGLLEGKLGTESVSVKVDGEEATVVALGEKTLYRKAANHAPEQALAKNDTIAAERDAGRATSGPEHWEPDDTRQLAKNPDAKKSNHPIHKAVSTNEQSSATTTAANEQVAGFLQSFKLWNDRNGRDSSGSNDRKTADMWRQAQLRAGDSLDQLTAQSRRDDANVGVLGVALATDRRARRRRVRGRVRVRCSRFGRHSECLFGRMRDRR